MSTILEKIAAIEAEVGYLKVIKNDLLRLGYL